ncbi:MAG: ABC transporter substrate-binding protein [Leeuwenhoekiella sp.]
MNKIKIALDWTANVNHIGLYIARDLGYYSEKKLEISIHTADEDHYKTTPAKKVELGEVDFALCPMESIISYQTKRNHFGLIAIATIYQNDLSAIACTALSGLKKPKDLDGRSYASYAARYEDKIVQEMIKNDGGSGNLTIKYPQKLGIWETLVTAKYDATWIFTNWEALQAESRKIDLNLFKMSDYGIPYSYSPVIACDTNKLKTKATEYSAFLKASKKGFLYAKNNPKEAAALLAKYIPESDKTIDLEQSIKISSKSYGSDTEWGTMSASRITEFTDWLKHKNLEQNPPEAEKLFSNSLLS